MVNLDCSKPITAKQIIEYTAMRASEDFINVSRSHKIYRFSGGKAFQWSCSCVNLMFEGSEQREEWLAFKNTHRSRTQVFSLTLRLLLRTAGVAPADCNLNAGLITMSEASCVPLSFFKTVLFLQTSAHVWNQRYYVYYLLSNRERLLSSLKWLWYFNLQDISVSVT